MALLDHGDHRSPTLRPASSMHRSRSGSGAAGTGQVAPDLLDGGVCRGGHGTGSEEEGVVAVEEVLGVGGAWVEAAELLQLRVADLGDGRDAV